MRGFILSALIFAPAVLAQIPGGITYAPVFGTDGANRFVHPGLMEEIPGKPGFFIVTEMGSGNIYVLSPGPNGYAKSLFGTVKGNAAEADMGLTGLAFHPDYANNHKYYVRYGGAQRPPRQNFLDERIAAADNLRDSGTPGRRLLTVNEPEEFSDHNGGPPIFGPDGYLYIGFGDGGWDQITPDAHKNGQNRSVFLGKLLRIDVDKRDAGLPYAIPADNPFVTDADPGVKREIYSYGLRNPYRLALDRATKEMYIGDIGWTKFDEIDIAQKGGNFGWSLKEGSFCLPGANCDNAGILDPIGYGANPAIVKCLIGGQVYRGDSASPFYGVYLFGDYTLGRLMAFKKSAGAGPAASFKDMGAAPSNPIYFTLDAMNNIYMVTYDAGTIYKLTHAQLMPQATTGIGGAPIGASAASSRGKALIAYARDGRVALPPGSKGRFEAVSPQGRRLGVVSPDGNYGVTLPPGAGSVPGSGEGVVLLIPLVR
ncbi:MAG: glucose sorbosone dehydrogenase [Fibrobacteres bacterium]|nr:glucose sorbosone dehydrogenase [Fibrobacterota bacterium]